MKDENINKGIQDIHKIGLHPSEKDRMLEHLIEHAESVKSPVFFGRISRYSAVGMLALIIVAGGATLAAGQALPGDILYPVKIYISEPIQGFFKIDPQAKAEWEVEKVNKRIEEAEHIIQQGKSDEHKEDIKEKEDKIEKDNKNDKDKDKSKDKDKNKDENHKI